MEDKVFNELDLSGKIVASILNALDHRKGCSISDIVDDEGIMQEITNELIDIVDELLNNQPSREG